MSPRRGTPTMRLRTRLEKAEAKAITAPAQKQSRKNSQVQKHTHVDQVQMELLKSKLEETLEKNLRQQRQIDELKKEVGQLKAHGKEDSETESETETDIENVSRTQSARVINIQHSFASHVPTPQYYTWDGPCGFLEEIRESLLRREDTDGYPESSLSPCEPMDSTYKELFPPFIYYREDLAEIKKLEEKATALRKSVERGVVPTQWC